MDPSAILDTFNTVPIRNWEILAGIGAATLLLRFIWSRNRRGPLPPGPPGLPLLGNLLQLDDKAWYKFTEWKKQYGDLVYVNFAGQGAIIINSHKVATDLLDRRAGIYSDRAKNIVTGILTGGLMFAFSQHNELWKRMRRGAHESLHSEVVKNYHHHQESESILLVEQLLKKPLDWDDHLRRSGVSLMMSMLYGVPPLKDSSDPIINQVNHFSERALHAAAPGSFLVEYFTWMKYLPRWMSPWRRYAEDWFKKDSILFKKLFSETSARVQEGDMSSVCAKLIDEQRQLRTNLDTLEASWVVANLYTAGAETTSGEMGWWMMAMVLHPEAQKAAQAEIDRVVGRDRMPSFKDYDRLHYVRAMVKEILRWRMVTPLGGPHRLCADDYYEGYFIPADTVCIPNVWGMNHDPAVYGPDAEEFRPERHLTESGTLKPNIPNTKDENHVTYGFGRRICVGRHVANNSLFMQMASILWGFNISRGPGKDGKEVVPNPMISENNGLAVRPKAFTCKVSPRFDDLKPAIDQAKEGYGLSEYS